jgi:hypothetical protein
MADELPVTQSPPEISQGPQGVQGTPITPGSADLFRLIGYTGGIGCCLPIVLITGFCVFMLFIAAIMKGCN